MMNRRRAFTLIELLVVIAILALLISILLPGLRQARETARGAVSMANLKSIGVAMFGYNQENKDYWPAEHYEGPGGSWISWPPRLRKYLGGDHAVTGIFYCPSTPKDFKWELKAKSSDMPPGCKEIGYTDLREQGLNYNVSGNKMYFSYGYNGWGANDFNPKDLMLGLGGHCDTKATPLSAGQKWMREVKTSDIAIPQRMIAIGDSIGDGVWDTWITSMGSPNPVTGYNANGLGPRHLGRCGVLNADFAVKQMNPRDLLVNGVSITNEEKIRRIEQWNRQGKSFDLGAGSAY